MKCAVESTALNNCHPRRAPRATARGVREGDPRRGSTPWVPFPSRRSRGVRPGMTVEEGTSSVAASMFRRVLLLTALIPTAAFAAPVETVVVTASPPDPVGNAAFSVATVPAQDLHDNTELDRALAQVPG